MSFFEWHYIKLTVVALYMSFNNKYVLAATDITSQPKIFAKFRGKTAKEIYRFSKGVIATRKVVGPATYALMSIPKEMSKGFINSAVGDVGETFIGYISGVTFLRYFYKFTNIVYITRSARIAYNFISLPMTCYGIGTSYMSDLFQLSRIEEAWFGSPVYLFDDNRLWIESNFTLEDAFKDIDGGK